MTGGSPQYGLLGESSGRKIALDLNQTHTISLLGVQGGGKSYTVGSIIEMACMPSKLASLGPGEAYVWSGKATDDAFIRGAVKVRCRPRVTQHGGGTKTATAPVGE